VKPLPQRIGRYEVLDRLGEGGMGLLYLARDPVLDRTVALKVLSVFNPEIQQRFAGEARSAARLTHPNIITIYDVGEDTGQPFIAMEYIDGETLGEVIRRRAPLRLTRRLELMLQLCAGLGHAHKMGIIHRDIKPANLMLTADGVLKILDFGLARIVADAATSGLTRVGAMLGTPHYMSPEQAMGQPADHRSDIFAVGLVMYELLTWQKAFAGESPHVVMHRIAHDSPRPIRELFPMIDAQLEEIVQTALQRNPEKRYQSLGTFASAIVRARDNIVAQSDSTTVRVERPAPGEPAAPPADSSKPRSDSGSGSGKKTPLGGIRLPSREALAKRRAEQIDRYVTEGRAHLDAGRFDAAIEQCELALILDTGEPRALETLHAAQTAIEDGQIQHWLADARAALEQGSLSVAEHLVEQSLQVRPDEPGAQALQQELAARRGDRRRDAERSRAAAAAVERARDRFDHGELDSAVRAAEEALEQDPARQDAQELKSRAAAALEARTRQQEQERRAQTAVAEALQRARSGDQAGALADLRAFEPPVTIVRDAIVAIEAEVRQLERQRREEAERQRRAQEDADRQRRAHDALVRKRQEQEPDAIDETVVITPQQEAEAGARQRAQDLTAARRQEGEVRRRAAAAAMQARRQFIAGDHQGALATLNGFSPRELVAPVIAELETELRRLKRRRDDTPHPTPPSAPQQPQPTPAPSVPTELEPFPPMPAPSAAAPESLDAAADSTAEMPALEIPRRLALPAALTPARAATVLVVVVILIVAVITYSC